MAGLFVCGVGKPHEARAAPSLPEAPDGKAAEEAGESERSLSDSHGVSV